MLGRDTISIRRILNNGLQKVLWRNKHDIINLLVLAPCTWAVNHVKIKIPAMQPTNAQIQIPTQCQISHVS